MAMAASRSRSARRGPTLLLAGVMVLLVALAPAGQGDSTPPTVIGQSPPADATGVSPDIDVSAIFSEPIQADTLSFVLRNSLSRGGERAGHLRFRTPAPARSTPTAPWPAARRSRRR